MKKIVLMLLVAMVPFLTMAQKRSKKSDKQTTSGMPISGVAKVEYMMIKGVEIPMNNETTNPGEDIRAMGLGNMGSENVKVIVAFDYGNTRSDEAKNMQINSRRFRTMISAANAAAENGWEFINSNVISKDKMTIHYYYMKRKKKK